MSTVTWPGAKSTPELRVAPKTPGTPGTKTPPLNTGILWGPSTTLRRLVLLVVFPPAGNGKRTVVSVLGGEVNEINIFGRLPGGGVPHSSSPEYTLGTPRQGSPPKVSEEAKNEHSKFPRHSLDTKSVELGEEHVPT